MTVLQIYQICNSKVEIPKITWSPKKQQRLRVLIKADSYIKNHTSQDIKVVKIRPKRFIGHEDQRDYKKVGSYK